ncbi:MAG TPA: alginate export family protein [Terriglobales bacterium]|nr:alginate export family protein [Terriglobales bacterium]
MARRDLAAAVVLLLLSALASAQSKPVELGDVVVTGSVRFRVESWQWFETPLADGSYTFGANQVRLGIQQKRRNFDWMLELEQPTLFGLPDDAIAPPPQGALGLGANYFASNGREAAGIFLKQGFLRLRLPGTEGNSLRLGRFEFIEGLEPGSKDATIGVLKRDRIAHRLIGNFGFSHVGRSFDGAQLAWNPRNVNVTLMAGRATRGVFQVDGMGELDADVLYGALTRGTTSAGPGEWRLFAVMYHDGRRTTKTDNRPLPARVADAHNLRVTTVGADLLHVFPTKRAGSFDVLLWGALQGGSWGVQEHRGWAVALEAGWQPPLKQLKPWLRAGWNRSSGDDDPADASHRTFFQVLPTPRIYARFPFFNLMNTDDLFAELVLRPHARLTVRSDVHSLRLASSKDLWYQGGGAYDQFVFGYAGRPSGGNTSLATLFDVSADVTVSKNITVTGYFADAEGKQVISQIYPADRSARFGYLEFNYRF